MNTHTRASDVATAERPADDGLPRRRRWTMSEVEKAVVAGILHEDEHIELIDGDLVAMSPKGRHHEIVRHALVNRWATLRPETIMLGVEPALHLDEEHTPEPDLILYPAPIFAPDVRGETVLLVIEISDSSYSYDIKIKGPLYARFGVREYWVIDARSLKTTIHREPGIDGYSDIREYEPDERVEPLAAPMLGLKISELRTE